MSYVEKVLLPDERVLYAARLHWVLYSEGLLLTAYSLLGFYANRPILNMLLGEYRAVPLIQAATTISIVFLMAGFFLLLESHVRRKSTELVLTNKRLIAKYGFIRRDTFEIMNRRISGANFDQTVLGRFLGYGNVSVHGVGGELSKLGRIADPEGFYRALVHTIDAHPVNGWQQIQQRTRRLGMQRSGVRRDTGS